MSIIISPFLTGIINYRAFIKKQFVYLHLMETRELNMLLDKCSEDIVNIVASGCYCLDSQSRAYDLLSLLMDEVYADSYDKTMAEAYVKIYVANADKLSDSYDETLLREAAKERLQPYETACNDARFEAASAASLHEFAKETFDIWENGGIFMRRRALKELRERAGFRLESHRIGNYVAKTFDLMNEAQARFARSQQALFAADLTYKIRPGVYARIYEILTSASSFTL